jgi:hypothetical protein
MGNLVAPFKAFGENEPAGNDMLAYTKYKDRKSFAWGYLLLILSLVFFIIQLVFAIWSNYDIIRVVDSAVAAVSFTPVSTTVEYDGQVVSDVSTERFIALYYGVIKEKLIGWKVALAYALPWLKSAMGFVNPYTPQLIVFFIRGLQTSNGSELIRLTYYLESSPFPAANQVCPFETLGQSCPNPDPKDPNKFIISAYPSMFTRAVCFAKGMCQTSSIPNYNPTQSTYGHDGSAWSFIQQYVFPILNTFMGIAGVFLMLK